MSKKPPTIRSSAQARLLLYRLLSTKLTEAEQRLLSVNRTSWEHIIAGLENMLESDAQMRSNRNVLAQAFSHIDKATCEGLEKQLECLTGQSLWLGVHATSLLESFVDEHLKLIKSVQREHLDKIGLAIKRGIREGRLHKDITKDIRQMTDISKRRAQLIARNAPLQYSGALTKHHQMSAGIKQYRWQTSHDERVRASHKSREGKVFAWDSPGPHPRSEVNCRCDAVPVLG
jgi:SPP1 gp7 family putative phage head morphogenesis protein